MFFVFLQRKRSAVSGVKQEAQDVLGHGEDLLDEANQLSDSINKELEVQKSPYYKPIELFKTSVSLCVYFVSLKTFNSDNTESNLNG